MDTLFHDYKNIEFANLMKAQLRKYFDEIYIDKNLIVDISRKKISEDILEIKRIHTFVFLWKTYYMVEKILLDRKNKIYRSWINSSNYNEECIFNEVDGGVRYTQKYDISYFLKANKKKVFETGCEVVEKTINNLNLRLKI